MKKLIISTLIMFSGIMAVTAQEEIKTNENSQDLPEIFFEQTTYNFGNIDYEGNGTCEFVFKNTGKEPLLLTNVKATCGCTTPTWPKEPIKKGESGTIVVKYNTKLIGPFNKSIRVYSNAKTNLITLKIQGTVNNPNNADTSEKR